MVSPRLIFLAILSILSMSMVPVLIKSTGANEITIGIARLCIAVLLLSPLVLAKSNLPALSFKQWRSMAVIGIVFAVHWLLYFASIKLSTASIGALAVSTFGVQYLLLAQIFNGERAGMVEWCAIGLCLLGCLIVVPEFSLDNDMAVGILVGVLSGTLYACLPLLHQRANSMGNLTRSWGQFLFALLAMLPLLSFTDWNLPAIDYYKLAVLGVLCTVIAHGLWVKVTTELPAIYPTLIYYLYVPVAMVSSSFFLEEEMTGSKLAGAALILTASTGVTVYRLSARRN